MARLGLSMESQVDTLDLHQEVEDLKRELAQQEQEHGDVMRDVRDRKAKRLNWKASQ